METERQLAQTFSQDHPVDAARILERLSPPDASAYLAEVPPRVVANILERMVPANAADCLTHLSAARFAQVIGAFPLDRAAALLRRVDAKDQQRLLAEAPAAVAPLLRRMLGYPENSAGALMDPRALALPEDIIVSEALARVRRAPRHTLYYLYVVNRSGILVGVLNLRELMLATGKNPLSSVMRREVVTISPLANSAAILEHPGWQNVHALPVVDNQGVLLGALRYETLRQLEGKGDLPTPAGGALSTMLTLGELCWVGLAGVLTDLTTSIVAPSTPRKSEKEPKDG